MAGKNSDEDPKNTGCAYGKVNREKIHGLGKAFDEFKDNEFHALQKTVESIRDELLSRVPWPVTVLITAMSSLCVGLVVLVLMTMMK